MKTYKILVLGDFGVGKTSLIRRYVLDEFSDDYRATIGVHLYKHEDTLADADPPRPVSLVVWDIEGAPMPDERTRRYLVGASGTVIVGDSSRPDPFAAMEETAAMVEAALPGRPICFALNKRDLVSGHDPERTSEMSRRYDAPVHETSALTGDRVSPMFRALARAILSLGLRGGAR